ncbi:MAG: hypothetical protein ACXVB0_07830 [Mucilaginibacter sp.]
MNTNNKNTRHTAKCHACHEILDTRVKRNFLLRTLFFWLPIKVYFCPKCVAKRYIIQFKESYHEPKTA